MEKNKIDQDIDGADSKMLPSLIWKRDLVEAAKNANAAVAEFVSVRAAITASRHNAQNHKENLLRLQAKVVFLSNVLYGKRHKLSDEHQEKLKEFDNKVVNPRKTTNFGERVTLYESLTFETLYEVNQILQSLFNILGLTSLEKRTVDEGESML